MHNTAKMQTALDGLPSGIAIVRQWQPVLVNDTLAELLGYASPADLLEVDSILSLLTSASAENLRTVWACLSRDDSVASNLKGDAVRKDGSIVKLEQTLSIIDWNGEAASRWVVREATSEILELHEIKDRFHNLVEGSIQGIAIIRNWRPIFANQALADLLAYDSPQKLLEEPSIISWIAPHDVERIASIETARIAGEDVPNRYEADIRRKDGTSLTVENVVHSILWDGEPASQCTLVDITERKEAEIELRTAYTGLEEKVTARTRELRSANKKLQELDRLKSMFIASMSHELRTPLNAIIGFTGVLLQGMSGELNEQQNDQLNRVYGAAKHLLELITDIIDISKIEAGRIDFDQEDFELNELLDEALDTIRPQLRSKQLELRTDVPRAVRLSSDRGKLMQCLINLLSNAVKFTEKGEIKVHAKEQDRQAIVTVRDTGIGIDEDDLPDLFQPFERIDSHLRVRTPGTGLGLYLTKKIATELLGGSVSVRSRPSEGSAFTLAIPLVRRAQDVVSAEHKGTSP